MKKAIQIILFLVFIALVALIVYLMSGNLSLKIGAVGSKKNAFEDYKVQVYSGDGMYRVEMKDLVTSTGSGKQQYYRYDIMFDMVDKTSTKVIQDKRDQVAAIINSVMSTFPPEDLTTEAQRLRVKRLIADKVQEFYPDIQIKDLYFTNYVYN